MGLVISLTIERPAHSPFGQDFWRTRLGVTDERVASWMMVRMSTANSLHEILDLVAKKMQLDFEESARIEHRGSKGTVRERDIQRTFLEKYLPGVARVTGSGELVSTDGQVSGQCDLMIVDVETPPLWKKEDYAIIPVECCYVVVEVKSELTAGELKKSWAASKKVKSLPRTAYLPPISPISMTRNAYGREWPHAFPVRHIVFGYEGATLDTLAKEMSVLAQQDADPWVGIDAVCVLNRGVVSWQNTSTGAFFERQTGSMAFTSPTTPGNVLLFMLTSLNDLLATARYNEKFNIKGYIAQSLGQVATRWRDGVEYEAIPVGNDQTLVRPKPEQP